MAFTIYDASVPVFQQILGSLSGILEKAEAHAAEKGIDVSTLLNASLAPDMFNFTRQIQIATDRAKEAVANLAGQETPKFDDNEKTVADLQQRIRKTQEFIASVPAAKFAGAENRDIKLVFPWATLEFTGQRLVTYWALPNFFFHVTTAYAILRNHGVALGKADFLGQ